MLPRRSVREHFLNCIDALKVGRQGSPINRDLRLDPCYRIIYGRHWRPGRGQDPDLPLFFQHSHSEGRISRAMDKGYLQGRVAALHAACSEGKPSATDQYGSILKQLIGQPHRQCLFESSAFIDFLVIDQLSI